MKKYILLASVLVSGVSFADVPEGQANEVDHLLNFVKTSSCTINRNGTVHQGEKAVKHIQKKYDYFRDDIKTTEDFIKYSASKSTLSGKAYMAYCPDKKSVKTQLWLLEELKRYRLSVNDESKEKNIAKFVVCKEPRPQMCTMEYLPVCAELNNESFKTYPSGCSACADVNVIKYKAGEC